MKLAGYKISSRRFQNFLTGVSILMVISSTQGQTFVGEILYQDAYQYVKLKCTEDTCTLSLPYLDGRAEYSEAVELKKNGTWSVRRGIERWTFNTALKDEGISGSVILPSGHQDLFLYEIKNSIEKEDLARYTGSFKNAEGQIAIVYERFDYLHLMSPFSEKTVGLKPISNDRFWNVAGETVHFKNTDGPSFTKLIVTDRRGKEHLLIRASDYEVTTIRPVIGPDTLHGEIFKPQGSGPFPAVLILPGGGNRSQIDNFRFEARYFVSIGMVAMIFDKPGVGESTGLNFDGLTFSEKTTTYEHVFDYFGEFDFVDTDKVGVHGSSEGGRLSLMMAINRPDRVAFVNAVSAPIMTMREGQLFAMDHYHRNLGLSEAIIMETREIWNHYYSGIIADTISAKYSNRIVELQAKYQRVFLPPSSTALPLSPNKFDLQNDLVATKSSAIQCPVFLQYGENDQRVHANASIRNFYSHGVNSELVDVQVYNRGTHSLMTPEYMICPGYMADKKKWLEEIGVIE